MNTIDIRRDYSSVIERLRGAIKANADWDDGTVGWSIDEEVCEYYSDFLSKCIEDDVAQLKLAFAQETTTPDTVVLGRFANEFKENENEK